MTDEYRNVKADAKAEKARAKAMRPWWKKKRIIIPGVLVLLAIIGGAAGGGSGGSKNDDGGDNNTSATASDADSNFSTNDEHKPVDDVEITGCEKTVIDTVNVNLRVTNNSSKESNYTISLSLEDANGTKIGDGFASTSNVDPGQVAETQGFATLSGSKANFTCKVEDVERFAS